MAAPDPAPAPVRRRRRRKTSRGRPTLLITLAVSALLLGAVPLADYLLNAPREHDGPGDGPPKSFDLVLSESFFAGEGADRHVIGVLQNTSRSHYSDVKVQFIVRGRANALLGRISAVVGEVSPGASTPFRTEPVPEGAVRIALAGISGAPR